MEQVSPRVWKVCSVAVSLARPEPATTFIDVLKGWGHTWLWDKLKVTGGTSWIANAIAEGMLEAVADGLYIREQHPDLCTAAFILECTRHRGMLVGSFPEASKAANAYQGELLGLMAIHLLLLAVNSTVSLGLAGRVKIYLDCLGALVQTAELPPHRIPTRCKHSNILKTILVNCGGLSFHREYIHVEAHQDNLTRWEDLSQEAQLNVACNAGAKAMLRSQDVIDLSQQEPFPLEPIRLFVEGTKMTSDTQAHIQYAAGQQVARTFFHEMSRMFTNVFDVVDWPQVHRTLNEEVPRLFQVWASKQVMNLAATNKNLRRRHRDGRSNKCPCCTVHMETAKHVILCPEEGRVDVFMQLSELLERWLCNVDTDPELADCIVEYVQGRGQLLMEEIVWGAQERFKAMGRSQDKIGWRQFLEGMISKEITGIQQQHYALSGSRLSLERWSSGLITRLLEITHRQWVYWNFIVHDPVSGTIAMARKEELLREIERQWELGDADLLEEDKYLAEVNLEGLEDTSGERRHYWLLAIKTAQKVKILREQQEQQQAVSRSSRETGR